MYIYFNLILYLNKLEVYLWFSALKHGENHEYYLLNMSMTELSLPSSVSVLSIYCLTELRVWL